VVIDFTPKMSQGDIDAALRPAVDRTTESLRWYVVGQRLKWLAGSCLASLFQIVGALVITLISIFGLNPLSGFSGLWKLVAGCGKLLWAPLASVRRPSQRTASVAARSFYSSVLGLSVFSLSSMLVRDWAGALLVTAPARRPRPLRQLQKSWTDAETLIKGLVIGEQASCSLCGRREYGVRIAQPEGLKEYDAPSDSQIRSADIFHECRTCRAVYCGPCFAGMTDADICRSCGMFLPKGGYPPSLPMVTPRRVEFRGVSITDVAVDPTANDHVMLVTVTVSFEAVYHVAQKDQAKSKTFTLGKSDTLRCRFHNCALLLHSRWYLLGVDVGEPLGSFIAASAAPIG